MSKQYRKLGKPLAMRTIELVRALQLLRDSLKAIREGRSYHLISLSAQLRALLVDRSGGADPLLLYMAATLKKELKLFCLPDVDDPGFSAELRAVVSTRIARGPATLLRQSDQQRECSLDDYMNYKAVLHKGSSHSLAKVIEWFANSAGGAHYSRHLPEDFAELLNINLLGVPALADLLINVGDLALSLGRRLLKTVVDLEFHIVMVVPPQAPAEANYLFDASYLRTPMRLTLSLNRRLVPRFTVTGLQETSAYVECEHAVDWNIPHYLKASVTIDDDLTTRIELAVDGRRAGRSRSDEPLFVLSDPQNYDRYYNRCFETEGQPFSFGLTEVVMTSAEIEPVDQANLLLYFDEQYQNADLPVGLYEPGSFGRTQPGERNITNTGTMRAVKARDVLPGFVGKPNVAPVTTADQDEPA